LHARGHRHLCHADQAARPHGTRDGSFREGVPSRLLIGSARSRDIAVLSAVEGGEAIGLATYGAIFNSSPKLPDLRLIIFDDPPRW
ncbi:MAG: hypothetical protein ACRCZD_11255, partial [Phycicoccus sp.]